MEKVRWGIMSTAKIGMEHLIPAIQLSEYCEIVAIASQQQEKAQSAAKRFDIPKAFGSYEELLADTEVDAVYIPLPNHLHVTWCKRAIAAGKHVLCEKPIGLTYSEAESLLKAVRQNPELKVMEAFMYRFHPQWQQAKQLVVDGAIGKLQTIQSFFSYYNDDAANIRNQAKAGGGALMDIGCYCLSLSRYIFGAEPTRVFGSMQYDPRFKTDYLTSGILDFDGRTSTFTCSTQLAPYQRVIIHGVEGRIEIEIPFNAPSDKPCRMWIQTAKETREIAIDICNQYTLQASAFALSVLNNTNVPTSLEDAAENMRVLENIVKSAKDGAWV